MKKINENVQKLHEKLRKNAEEAIKQQYIPEQNTINWIADNLPRECFRKNNGYYTTSTTYKDAKDFKIGVLQEINLHKKLERKNLNGCKR